MDLWFCMEKKYVFLCSFVPSVIHFSSTWAARATATQAPLNGTVLCFTQSKRLGAKHRGVVQPRSMTPAPRTALWSSDPDKGRSHKTPAPSPTTVPDWWAPSSSPLHPAELQPASITALMYPCPGCNI